MTFLGYLPADPWAPAEISLWPNINLDRSQFAHREALIQAQVKDFKLERAIHDGRIYGLARDHYTSIRKAKLARLVSRPQGDKAM